MNEETFKFDKTNPWQQSTIKFVCIYITVMLQTYLQAKLFFLQYVLIILLSLTTVS